MNYDDCCVSLYTCGDAILLQLSIYAQRGKGEAIKKKIYMQMSKLPLHFYEIQITAGPVPHMSPMWPSDKETVAH